VGDRFYLLGGRGDRPVQVFDPETQTWETLSAPPFQMHHFQAVAYEGKIYIIGAFTNNFPGETPVPHVYVFDPAQDTWTQGPEIPADRRRGSAGVVVYEGQFYLVCGIQNGHNDGYVPWLDRFDPDTETWTRLTDAPRARDHFQAAVIDGRLYAAGGRRTSNATGESVELTEEVVDVYDFAAGTWTSLPSSANLPTKRAGTTAVVFRGNLVVLGGESERRLPEDGNEGPPSAHSEVEAYNPSTGTWISLPPLIEGRHGTQAISYENMIYIAAGSRTLGATEINSHEVYVP
jgi:N-acetylneuraminic acid mutarotase